jgi:glycosyltransferase involved in cell wall biosynthesis
VKILIISTYDLEGGAARATYRLHQCLQNIALDSQMLVQTKYSDEKTVLGPQRQFSKEIQNLRPSFNALPLVFYPQCSRSMYSSQWLPDSVVSKVAELKPDIINIHWISAGFLQVETLAKLRKPLVWTLHDMWPFTGGCHYTQGCDRYTKSCGACPALGSSNDRDLSRWVWQRKAKAWRNLNLTIITPSRWLAECASSSSLFQERRIEVIPNGLDTTRYKPMSRQMARELFNLPQDKQLVLFVAMNGTSNPIKGFHLLQPTLQNLSQSGWQDRIELVVLGSSQPSELPSPGFKVHYLGKLNDDISLALVYAAVDVFVAPSIQDNFPNTLLEAMACGKPCVAFNIGGMPDMIEHQRNGYLARPFEVEELAQGIAWVLEDVERYLQLCARAREKAETKFSMELQARSYMSLFEEVVKKTSSIYN